MNVDTGQLGRMDDVLRDAKSGERVIPATIIPDPFGQQQGVPLTDEHIALMMREQQKRLHMILDVFGVPE